MTSLDEKLALHKERPRFLLFIRGIGLIAEKTYALIENDLALFVHS